jgi:hypothetical protein
MQEYCTLFVSQCILQAFWTRHFCIDFVLSLNILMGGVVMNGSNSGGFGVWAIAGLLMILIADIFIALSLRPA